MELIKDGKILISYQRQGNNINGLGIYSINIFLENNNKFQNINYELNEVYKAGFKLDKYYNIKISCMSYQINETLTNLIKQVKKLHML
jgi:hypothetical protein